MIYSVLGLVSLVPLCVWIGFPSERRVKAAGNRFAREQLAFVDSEFVTAFDRTWVWQSRFAGAALFVGLGVFTGLVPAVESSGQHPWIVGVPVLATLATTSVAARLLRAGREFPAIAGRPVVARVRKVTVSDYVPRRMRLVAWIAMVTAVVEAVLALAFGNADELSRVCLAVGVFLALLTAITAEIGAARICARPQSSVDACHLYVQDAWRAQSLVQCYLPIALTATQLIVGAGTVAPYLFPLSMVGFVALIFGSVFSLANQRYFRARLWPTLLPGQVLYPGQPVPSREQVPA